MYKHSPRDLRRKVLKQFCSHMHGFFVALRLLSQMTVDDDFSFVRFLKVVKSLYESSTFTQLGKTVGTALREDEYDGESTIHDDDETLGGGSLETVDEDEENKAKAREAAAGALSRAFAACYKPGPEISKKEIKDYDPSKDKPSLLEKVVTCTLNHDDGIMSDDDDDGTKRTLDDRTYDGTFGQSDSLTFDATEDEESLPKRKCRGRGIRGKK